VFVQNFKGLKTGADADFPAAVAKQLHSGTKSQMGVLSAIMMKGE
jgi:hypothetical protein